MQSGKRLFLLAVGPFWVASTAVASEVGASASAAVRLVSPLDGAVLGGGETAVLEWAPADGFESLLAEEWEAFVSVDGGASYPWRITPHLDVELHRFFWQVPNLPADRVQLLLRFGDERREIGVELPQRFSIRQTRVTRWAPTAASRVAGEAARPGDRGVVAWIEGDRRGGSTREVRTAAPPLATKRAALPAAGHPGESAVAESQTSAPDLGQSATDPVPGLAPRRATDPPQDFPLPPIDVLLQTCRLNE